MPGKGQWRLSPMTEILFPGTALYFPRFTEQKRAGADGRDEDGRRFHAPCREIWVFGEKMPVACLEYAARYGICNTPFPVRRRELFRK